MKKVFALLLTLSFLSLTAKAGVLLNLGGTYLTDAVTSSASTDSSKYGYNFNALFSINKTLWGGWSYSGFSSSETKASVTTLITGQDTGPTFLWQFGRNKNFSTGLTYNLISRANFSNGTTTEAWEGTSYVVQVGANPELKENFRMGVSLNYYSASYTKKTVSNVQSSASYSRTWLYPAISITKEF